MVLIRVGAEQESASLFHKPYSDRTSFRFLSPDICDFHVPIWLDGHLRVYYRGWIVFLYIWALQISHALYACIAYSHADWLNCGFGVNGAFDIILSTNVCLISNCLSCLFLSLNCLLQPSVNALDFELSASHIPASVNFGRQFWLVLVYLEM